MLLVDISILAGQEFVIPNDNLKPAISFVGQHLLCMLFFSVDLGVSIVMGVPDGLSGTIPSRNR